MSPVVLQGVPPTFDLGGRKRYGPDQYEAKRFETDKAGKIVGATTVHQDVTDYHPELVMWAEQVAAKVIRSQGDAIDDALMDDGQDAMDATARADFERTVRPGVFGHVLALYAGVMDAALDAREDA